MRLLVVEDDAALGERLRTRLVAEGYAVDLARDGIDGAHLGATEPYDAVVLDLGLPGKPGLAVLREWRAAAFVDHGGAAARWGDFSGVTGAGLGARWVSPVGALGADIARGFDEKTWRLHIALGLAF